MPHEVNSSTELQQHRIKSNNEASKLAEVLVVLHPRQRPGEATDQAVQLSDDRNKLMS